MSKATRWVAAAGLPGYVTRLNDSGHRETRPTLEVTLEPTTDACIAAVIFAVDALNNSGIWEYLPDHSAAYEAMADLWIRTNLLRGGV